MSNIKLTDCFDDIVQFPNIKVIITALKNPARRARGTKLKALIMLIIISLPQKFRVFWHTKDAATNVVPTLKNIGHKTMFQGFWKFLQAY